MADTPTVKLGDNILGGANTYGWGFSSGIEPAQQVWTVTLARVDQFASSLGQPLRYEVTGDTREAGAWEQLYLLEIQAGEDPFVRRLRVADRRWLWPKQWVAVSMNIRRATGDTFLAGGARLENKVMLDSLRYAEYSLAPVDSPVAPWTAREALEYVLGELLATPVRFEDEPPAQVEIQDLVIDDPGNDAVAILLSYLPGMSLYIDREGTAVIYDTQSGKEAEILASSPPFQTGGGTVTVVDRRAQRPSKVVVLFTSEIEQRFDYTEPKLGGTGVRNDDTPVLRAVMPSPDIETTLPDGEKIVRGSYAKQSDLFVAWGAFGRFDKAVDFDVMRKHVTKYGGASFMQAWGNNPHHPPDPVNTARASTALSHWRRTFQIDRFWVQRLQSIRAYRASIVVQSLGVYSPSEVFADWTRKPSFFGFASGNDGNHNQGWAVRGYPESGLLDDAKAAPARVTVVDQGAGIITIDPALDVYGLAQAQWFGFPEGGILPSQDAGKGKREGNALYRHWYLVEFEAEWKMAVVLTVVPGSPNHLGRFYQVEVVPEQIQPAVGISTGPVLYARVFPGVMTARFGWRDEEKGAIEAVVKGEGDYNTIKSLLLNEDFVQNVALATAQRVYETLRDRPLGKMVVDWSPGMAPAGSLGNVAHVMQGGQLVTAATFHAVKQPTDIWRFMNASTRKAVLRVLDDQGSAG